VKGGGALGWSTRKRTADTEPIHADSLSYSCLACICPAIGG
jgi:hypothetical protein